MDKEIIALKNEIRDLKTAQLKPSIMKMYSANFKVPAGTQKGFHYWTIHYEQSDNPTEPITYDSNFLVVPEFYDSVSNTQKVVLDVPYNGTDDGEVYTFFSTRQISSITMDS